MYYYATDPADVPVADVMVEVHGFARGPIEAITETIGGEAHWVEGGIVEGGYRQFEASTLVEDVEGYDIAKDIVSDLIHDHLDNTVDLDNLFIQAMPIEDDEVPDRDHDW